MSTGARIKRIRDGSGLTQEDFALKVGAESKSTVSNWETDRRLPNIEQLIKIAQLGNTTLDWIIHGAGTRDETTINEQMILKRIKEWGIESVEELDKFLNHAVVAKDIESLIKEKITNYSPKKRNISDRWEPKK
jgi:transcriptional regulator with XRE-family HTH domain